MKLIHSFIWGALCVSLSSCVFISSEPKTQEPTKYDNNEVVVALRKSGISVYFDTEYCQKSEIFGTYDMFREYVEICAERHDADSDELRDTIRHEAVHAIQDCINGSVYSKQQIKEWATFEELEYVIDNYLPRSFARELEATVMSRKYSDSQMAKFVYNFCINR